MIESLLDRLEVSTAELSAIAVAKGPGSYTGLRVGVSTAKGLCMALDKPLLSMGSLDVLAWKVQALAQQLDAWIVPLLDARRMEVYCAFFDAQGKQLTDTQAMIIDQTSFQETLADRKVIFLGSGAKKCTELLQDHPNSIMLPEQLSSASSMGTMLSRKFQLQEFEDLVDFEPFYLKDFVATKPKNKLRP